MRDTDNKTVAVMGFYTFKLSTVGMYIVSIFLLEVGLYTYLITIIIRGTNINTKITIVNNRLVIRIGFW